MGLIVGWNLPPDPHGPSRPDWLDPEATFHYRERPHLSISIQTNDGGKTWQETSASMFGTIARVRFTTAGLRLGLLEYSEVFEFPSEVLRIAETRSETIYRDKKFAVTDLWVTSDGTAYLAGAIHPGQVRDVLPGKIQVLKGNAVTAKFGDPLAWTPIDVDYRAVARTAMLSGSGGQVWMATDSGIILKLVP